MSLINDALKKAQRERSGAAHQPLPAATATPGTGFHSAPKPATNLWPIAIAAIALVGGGAAVWFLKPSAPAPVTIAANVSPAAPVVITPQAQVSPPPAPVPTVTPSVSAQPPAPETPEPQLHINLPGSTPPPAPAPVAPLQQAPVQAPVAAVAPAPTSPSPTAFQVTLQLEDPRVLAFLDNARINGIRIAVDDAKLLMNNKVFRAGDVVDRELGLKLATIRPTELVFEDKRGIQYRKLL